MTMKSLFAGVAAATLLLSACQPAPTAKTDEATVAAVAGQASTAATITAVTDAGYPMFAVTATVPGQPAPLELLLNAEEADLGGVEPASLAGKAVTLGYASKDEPSLVDIRAEGHSLLGTAAPKSDDPAWTVVTGTLGGAATPTAGDLPDTIEIADAQGVKHAFDYFITPEIVAANGKQVTGYYVTGTVNRVTSIKLAAQ
ncbi:MAG: hypothetical protein IV086_02055 [Hyphomonadaceae bacterium]|nr:MAG: hypothetical protein FD160_1073 [Caulobacteraceae bacterium]MBT9444464.1 hypothetical protein [Hyphomonadaceae bacterium]TPW07109.1 MAG: hypothetical protein FD124_1384 [Alphaproteobacteria bacterium]